MSDGEGEDEGDKDEGDKDEGEDDHHVSRVDLEHVAIGLGLSPADDVHQPRE